MIRAAKYRAAQDRDDGKWGVYMRTWDDAGNEFESCIQQHKDQEAAEKSAIKWQNKENASVAKQNKIEGKVFLASYAVRELNYTGPEKGLMKFLYRYLSEEQIKMIMTTGKIK